MENTKISRSEIIKLSSSMLGEISPHSLGQWLKSKTDDQYIIVPRSVIIELENQIESLSIWL